MKGIMGVVSGAVLEAGGSVTGIVPAAMIASGGEKEAVRGEAELKAAAEALIRREKRKNVRGRPLASLVADTDVCS